MRQNVLIAEPCEILRVGLRTILLEDAEVPHIYEAATSESLKTQLRNCMLDLVVINQSLITDVMILPKGKFVILVSEPNMTILKAAYKHGLRGYLSEDAPAEFIRMIRYSSKGSLLIEPTLIPWIMEHICGDTFSSIRDELLTTREKEIISLLREGLDRRTIAQRLTIAETTLKTHIKNIARKREVEQHVGPMLLRR